ncbi:MAG TPA: RtcB family protein [Burkholderiales bacterium]|nr:RtcB family protein [Burkholderiales bacterium]
MSYDVFQRDTGKPIKAWTKGVPIEDAARQQLFNLSELPFIYRHVAAMPDVHWGMGATVGSVIATDGAIIPAAVGVDIGCGMMAVRLDGARAEHLPANLARVRSEIEHTVPTGFEKHAPAQQNERAAAQLYESFNWLQAKHPKAFAHRKDSTDKIISSQFGSLGGGNHFIELCIDEAGELWVMLHSGSRGIGNVIGTYFVELAREDMRTHFVNLPDRDLAYFPEGTAHFDDYVKAVGWAQGYARANRDEMMRRILIVLHRHLPPFRERTEAINCHHNYVQREYHFGKNVWLTRKGAVRAREGELGIIPGSMGARSYIVRGKGNPESFHSCSHGAGRKMSRTQAKKCFTVHDHALATEGVECRKDAGVIDETPAAYKDIDAVMAAQSDLVEVVHTLKQVVCVKG